MALNFENTFSDADFLPSPEEIESYKAKIDMYTEMDIRENITSPKKLRLNRKDEYDSLGRNITEQERRQNKVPWVKVVYNHGKLFIDPDKKNILRSMNLI